MTYAPSDSSDKKYILYPLSDVISKGVVSRSCNRMGIGIKKMLSKWKKFLTSRKFLSFLDFLGFHSLALSNLNYKNVSNNY